MARASIAIGVGVLALLASGCTHHRLPRGGETITYQVSQCKGRCPAYSLTLGPDGQGIFTAEANAGPSGDHRFQASRQQVHDYTAALAKVRPREERLVVPGRRDCTLSVTDQSTIDVVWQGAGGPATHLRVYLGCRGGKATKLRNALQGLPSTYLPLQAYLGSD